jgi:hypothetical protein
MEPPNQVTKVMPGAFERQKPQNEKIMLHQMSKQALKFQYDIRGK